MRKVRSNKKSLAAKPSAAIPSPMGRALRLHGSIARTLGTKIVSGEIQPGETLSGEISSAEQLSVSRTAYREAVRILAAKGLVDARPKRGTRVNPRESWQLMDPDVLDWAFASEPDLVLLDSLFELRNVVESAAAGFAAERRTTTHVKRMSAALEGMARHTLATEAGRQADLEFHTTLLVATANPFFVSLANGVRAAVRATTIYKQRTHPLRRDPVPDHRRVFEAIEAGNSVKARSTMAALIQLARIDTPRPKSRNKRVAAGKSSRTTASR